MTVLLYFIIGIIIGALVFVLMTKKTDEDEGTVIFLTFISFFTWPVAVIGLILFCISLPVIKCLVKLINKMRKQ